MVKDNQFLCALQKASKNMLLGEDSSSGSSSSRVSCSDSAVNKDTSLGSCQEQIQQGEPKIMHPLLHGEEDAPDQYLSAAACARFLRYGRQAAARRVAAEAPTLPQSNQ